MSELNYSAELGYYEECIEIVICVSCNGTGVGTIRDPICNMCKGDGKLVKTTTCTYSKADKEGLEKIAKNGGFARLGNFISMRRK